MKFTVFVLIAGLCLVAITAKTTGDFEAVDKFDIEFFTNEFADDSIEIESFGVFSGMYWVLKAALRTLKGLNCAIQGAVNMKNAAQKFIDDVHACGGVVSKQVQAVINACQNVISTSNDIIKMNTNVCNNENYDPETDGGNKTGWSCFWKMLKKFVTLKKQIQKVISLVKKIPTAGVAASDCVTTAANELTTTFTGFPAFVKSCSKLTSN